MKGKMCTAIVVAMILGMAAGAYASGSQETGSSGTASPQTLNVWSGETNNAQWFDSQFKSFEADNNATIKLVTVPSDEFHTKFVAAVQAKTPIDALLQNGQDVRWMATSGLLKDLSSSVNYKSRFIPTTLEPYTIGGNLYGLPYGSMVTTVLYYNKQIFAQYGLQPPVTYDDLVTVSAELQKHGIYGIAMGGSKIYRWPMWYFEALAQTSGNDSNALTRETLMGNQKFTSAPYVQAMQALQRFGKDGVFEPSFNGIDMPGSQALFISGKAAMYFGGSWEVNTFLKAGMTTDNIGLLKFPRIVPGDKPVQMTGGSGNATTIYANIDASRLPLAQKFIDFVTSDSFDKGYCQITNSALPVNVGVSIDNATSLDKQMKNEFLPVTIPFLDWTWPPKVVTAFQEQIQSVVGQQTTPEKAMETVQSTFADLLSSGYSFK